MLGATTGRLGHNCYVLTNMQATCEGYKQVRPAFAVPPTLSEGPNLNRPKKERGAHTLRPLTSKLTITIDQEEQGFLYRAPDGL